MVGKARDGLLVISGGFVEFAFVGSLRQFELDYPIFVNEPQRGSVPAFPQ
jgi:hypothetical protein